VVPQVRWFYLAYSKETVEHRLASALYMLFGMFELSLSFLSIRLIWLAIATTECTTTCYLRYVQWVVLMSLREPGSQRPCPHYVEFYII